MCIFVNITFWEQHITYKVPLISDVHYTIIRYQVPNCISKIILMWDALLISDVKIVYVTSIPSVLTVKIISFFKQIVVWRIYSIRNSSLLKRKITLRVYTLIKFIWLNVSNKIKLNLQKLTVYRIYIMLIDVNYIARNKMER